LLITNKRQHISNGCLAFIDVQKTVNQINDKLPFVIYSIYSSSSDTFLACDPSADQLLYVNPINDPRFSFPWHTPLKIGAFVA